MSEDLVYRRKCFFSLANVTKARDYARVTSAIVAFCDTHEEGLSTVLTRSSEATCADLCILSH